jgi:signal transduction histidine kinase
MEYVSDINASGQHLLSLINDVLDLAKIEAGRLDLQLVEFSVRDSLEQCRVFVAPRVAEKSQSLNVEIESSVGTWIADERKFRQCVTNLLANASKFTDRGGAIRLRCNMELDELVVSVIDNGVGIASDQLDQLFQDFYQVGNSSSPNVANAVDGTGLGLALTKRLMELHGGKVSVDSELGRGSVFTLRFPAQVSA